jgi:ATP-dependent helicase HrpA
MSRRSGGQTPRLGFEELAALYEQQLNEQQVNSLHEFREARLLMCADDFVPAAVRKQLRALPSTIVIRNREVEIDYDVEEPATAQQGTPSSSAEDAASTATSTSTAASAPAIIGVACLRLPEKLARTLNAEELPQLDRPLRFIVTRGQRGAVRADTLEQLQELLEGPWSPNDVQGISEPGQDADAAPNRSATRPKPGPRAGYPKRPGPRGGKFGRSNQRGRRR